MESSYSIEPGENLVRMRVWGDLTVERLLSLINRVSEDPGFSPGMSAIADYREARGAWDYSDIQRLRDYVVQVAVPCEVRWAAVVNQGTLAAAGHVLIVISEALVAESVSARIRMKLFDDPQAALRWVRREFE